MRKGDALIEDQFLRFGHILHGVVALVVGEQNDEIRASIADTKRRAAGGQKAAAEGKTTKAKKITTG